MDTLALGLSLAAVVLYAAKLINFAADPQDSEKGHRLRHRAWATNALAIIAAFSPPRISHLMGHSLQPWEADLFRLIGLALVVVAAIIWAAGRGYLRGGSDRDVRRGAIANGLLVAMCMLAALALR